MSKLKDSGNVFKNVVLVTGYLKERRYAHLILACILGMITILTTHHLRHNTCRCYIFLLCKLEKEFLVLCDECCPTAESGQRSKGSLQIFVLKLTGFLQCTRLKDGLM